MQLLFLLSLLLPLALFSGHKVRHVYLTWTQEDTSHTMTINVHTTEDVDLIHLYYDEHSHKEDDEKYRFHTVKVGKKILDPYTKRHIFHIDLCDLDPGKKYYFIAGDPIYGFTKEYSFRTIAEDADTYRFVEGGDFEVTQEAKEIAAAAAQTNPDAILLGGDYPRNAIHPKAYREWDLWLDMYQEAMASPDGFLLPMVLAIGNNEVEGGYGKTQEESFFYYTYFPQNPMKLSYFIKRFGKDIVLFVLDSGHTEEHENQKDWLKSSLSKYNESLVKFATYHVPIYPSVRFAYKDRSFRIMEKILELCGFKEDPEKLVCPYSALGRKHWLPLFDEFELTCAFEHHDQTLKRTKFLRKGEQDKHGTLFLGDGGWGPVLQYTPIQKFFRSHFETAIGHISFFWLVEVNRNGIEYKAINKTGQVIDQCFQPLK